MPHLTPDQQAKVDAYAAAIAEAAAARRPEPDFFDPWALAGEDHEFDAYAHVVEGAAQVVANNMRRLRTHADLGQRALAEAMSAIGFEWIRQTVAEIERHARRVSLDEMFGLAILFGVPVTDLLAMYPGEALDVGAKGVVVLTAEHVEELVHGRDGKRGRGGPRWAAAARAVRSGVDVERPARKLWEKRRAEGRG